MKKVLIVLGSVRSSRIADNILAQLQTELNNYNDLEFTVADLKELQMPFFDAPNTPNDESFSITDTNVIKWTDLVVKSDIVIFLSPEYNASIPGALKNAIDWMAKPWLDKQVAMVGYGWSGAASALQHLTDIMTRLKSSLVEPQVSLFLNKDINPDGTAQGDTASVQLKSMLDSITKSVTA